MMKCPYCGFYKMNGGLVQCTNCNAPLLPAGNNSTKIFAATPVEGWGDADRKSENILDLRASCERLIRNLDGGKPLTGAFQNIRDALQNDVSNLQLERAVTILNKVRHRDCDSWQLNQHGEVAPEGSGVRMDYFTPFEAIVIATALTGVWQRGASMSAREIIEGMRRVEEYNDQFRQPNPNGANPICKPKLFNIEVCERCGNWIKGVLGACPAVPPEQRWGADYVPDSPPVAPDPLS